MRRLNLQQEPKPSASGKTKIQSRLGSLESKTSDEIESGQININSVNQ
jgi:hypothetical protein